MRPWLSLFCFAAGLAAAPDLSAATATMKCRPPRGAVAEIICGSSEYVAMDREIAALTDRAKTRLSLGEKSQLIQSEARYHRQRNGCSWAAHNSAHPGAAMDECIRASMEGRVKRLRDVVDRAGM